MLLHDTQELDDDLGARSDEDLSLAGLLGVVEGVERIVKNGSLDHFGGICVEILRSLRGRNEVSAEKDLRVSLPRAMSRESALLRMFLFSSMKTFLVEGSARSVLERRSVSETVRRRRRRCDVPDCSPPAS